eukprot:symbB.v1.2.019718.t1/scaffold1625.1/size152758/1
MGDRESLVWNLEELNGWTFMCIQQLHWLPLRSERQECLSSFNTPLSYLNQPHEMSDTAGPSGNGTSEPERARIPEFQAELLIPCGNKLGECPLWDDARHVLSWIDIQGKRLWQHNPQSSPEDCRSFELPSRPGSFCIAESGDYVLALEDGLFFFDPATEELFRIPQDFVPKGCRLNDGRVDLQGRFVVSGTVDRGEEPMAAVYRLNTDCSVETLLEKVRCGNSICFAEDGRMFFADPAFYSQHGQHCDAGSANCIWQFPDYAITGLSGASSIFVDAGQSRPDGSILDAEGGLWNAEFGAGRVVRYLPDGSVSMVVKVPVRYTTCAAFGGEDMQTLYITDATVFAHQRMSKKRREELPEGYAGGVFSVHLPVKGLPERKFAGRKNKCGAAKTALLADLQMQLVESAWSALRPGGVLVYSTCTLNSLENEEVCDYLLRKDATLQSQRGLHSPLPTTDLAGLGPSEGPTALQFSSVVNWAWMRMQSSLYWLERRFPQMMHLTARTPPCCSLEGKCPLRSPQRGGSSASQW